MDRKVRGQGTGIGLAVTHELVKLMGGTIDVSSQQGVGTEFTLLVPVSRDAQKYDASHSKCSMPLRYFKSKMSQISHFIGQR